MDPFSDYQAKARTAGQYQAEATTLPDLLKRALDEKLANSPLTQERSQAAGGFLNELGNAPTTVSPEATGGVILDPNQQANLISQRRSGALTPLIQANQKYDLMTGTLGDIVGQAGRAYQSRAQQAGSEADMAYKIAQLSLAASKASQPSKADTARQQSIEGIKLAQQRGQNVLKAIKKYPKATGSGAKFQTFFQRILGGELSPELREIQPAISDYNTQLFDIAGKAFTANEKSLLPGLVLNEGDGPETIKAKVSQAQRMLKQKESLALTGGLAPEEEEEDTRPSLEDLFNSSF